MISLNTENKLPEIYKWYLITKMFLLFALIATTFSIVGGFDSWWRSFMSMTILIGLPLIIYFLLSIAVTTYIVDDAKITINSGIIIKRSKSVSFDQIQNVENVSGLLARLFSLTKVNIWTASASQIHIDRGTSRNRPDESLYLNATDAVWLKDFVLSKRS